MYFNVCLDAECTTDLKTHLQRYPTVKFKTKQKQNKNMKKLDYFRFPANSKLCDCCLQVKMLSAKVEPKVGLLDGR